MANGRGGTFHPFCPMPDMTLEEQRAAKDAARAAARAARAAATDPDAADRVRDLLLALVPLPSGPVGGYWPLGDELDVRPLLRHLHAAGRTVALPISGPRGTALEFGVWFPMAALAPGRYGILEPGPDAARVRPAVLLVPLLAFDRTGHRLGYGAGYYDRTLAERRSAGPLLAIGVGYAGQEVAAVPRGPHDQALDWIVTEREVIKIVAHQEGLEE